MARNISVSEETLNWLRKNHAHVSYTTMAKKVGCCTDTLKRILAREGIQQFDGAKYVPTEHVKKWSRPCMKCGCTQSRPKNLYLCDTCRSKASDYA